MCRPFSEDGSFVQCNHRKREGKGGNVSMFIDVKNGIFTEYLKAPFFIVKLCLSVV